MKCSESFKTSRGTLFCWTVTTLLIVGTVWTLLLVM